MEFGAPRYWMDDSVTICDIDSHVASNGIHAARGLGDEARKPPDAHCCLNSQRLVDLLSGRGIQHLYFLDGGLSA